MGGGRYPELAFRQERIEVALMNKRIGIERSADDYARLLTKMQLPTVVAPGNTTLVVTVPPVRPDVLHA